MWQLVVFDRSLCPCETASTVVEHFDEYIHPQYSSIILVFLLRTVCWWGQLKYKLMINGTKSKGMRLNFQSSHLWCRFVHRWKELHNYWQIRLVESADDKFLSRYPIEFLIWTVLWIVGSTNDDCSLVVIGVNGRWDRWYLLGYQSVVADLPPSSRKSKNPVMWGMFSAEITHSPMITIRLVWSMDCRAEDGRQSNR